MILSIIAFSILFIYLFLAYFHCGITEVISDTYYKYSKIGFTFTMCSVAFLMMIAILNLNIGILCLAFLGCAGLMFVGVAPNYWDLDVYPVHKYSALVAAVGCIGWCLSACSWITFLVTFMYCLFANKHRWYWLEVFGFLDVFITFWKVA